MNREGMPEIDGIGFDDGMTGVRAKAYAITSDAARRELAGGVW